MHLLGDPAADPEGSQLHAPGALDPLIGLPSDLGAVVAVDQDLELRTPEDVIQAKGHPAHVTIGLVLRAVIVAVHAGCVAEEAVAHTQVSALQQSAVIIREWSRAPSSLHPCQARSHHGV